MGTPAGTNGNVAHDIEVRTARLVVDVAVGPVTVTVSARSEDPHHDVPHSIMTFHVSRSAPRQRFLECLSAAMVAAIARGDEELSTAMLAEQAPADLVALCARMVRYGVALAIEGEGKDARQSGDQAQPQDPASDRQRTEQLVDPAGAARPPA